MKKLLSHTVVILIFIVKVSIVHAQTWVQLGNDLNGSTNNPDNLGYSVYTDSLGTTLVIGSPKSVGNRGHASVFDWNGTTWLQRGSNINGESLGDWSGSAVCINGDGSSIAIGSPNNSQSKSNAGHVRVYDWNGTSWVQRGLDLDGESSNYFFGTSVSLSSDGLTLAAGATGADTTGAADIGHTKIYTWNGAIWVQKGLSIYGESNADRSGYRVSLSRDGNIIAISSHYNDGIATDAGHVRIYEWKNSAWIQMGLDIDGEASGDHSGKSISLSSDGMTVAIGAPNNDGITGGGTGSGHVRVYHWNGTSWIQKGNDIDGEAATDGSGGAVSLNSDGTVVAIGAATNDESGNNAGHTRVYTWNGNNWIQKGMDIDGEVGGDESGFAVSINAVGSIIAVGARYHDGPVADAGLTRVYSVCKTSSDTINQTLCYGGSIVVNGNIYDSTVTGAVEVITGVGTNQCDSTVIINLTINAPIDTTVNTTNIPTISSNQSGAAYQWIECTNGDSVLVGDTMQSFTATANGNYKVIVTVNGCSDTSACIQVSSVDLLNVNERHGVNVFPNPFDDQLIIQFGNSGERTFYELFDLTGKRLIVGVNDSQQEHINVSDIQPGIYFLMVDPKVFKIVKQK